MSDTVIHVENISKLYRLGEGKPIYGTLRDAVASAVQIPLRMFQRQDRNTVQDFWALRNVSFEVKEGEILGIIGRNGAGKSTLLKILSRITEPTSGQVRMRGRVRSLLEVGTGFHPELTGRENIYLNGAILGMKRNEIDEKFDDIVEFAETQQFLDTPVKRYSSGMYMRLAFSIAAHLEPEILIVDEVLAVGDASFQQKCLGAIHRVAGQGRTVLVVSHNMGVIQTLCTRALLLSQGIVSAEDIPSAVVGKYLSSLETTVNQDISHCKERKGSGHIRISRIEISTGEPNDSTTLATGRPARFVFHVKGFKAGASCSFTVYDYLGQPVTFFDSAMHSREDMVSDEKEMRFLCEIDALPLLPGRYRINAAIMCHHELEDHVEGAAFIDVDQGDLHGRPIPRETGYGSVLIPHRWTSPY